MNRVLLLLAAIFAVLGLLQCSQHPADQPHVGQDGTEGRVSKANQPWPLKEYPRMVARLGRETFERATLRIPAIARKASKNPHCDRVTYVGISNSSTATTLEYFVLCENGFRAELKEKVDAAS